jgi:uncharacterized damage-inducible protein DinB
MPKAMPPGPAALPEIVLGAWKTSNRVTTFLVENLPTELWAATIPEMPRRTIRMVASHIHNARCMWLKTLGRPLGIVPPAGVDRKNVQRRQLVAALNRSGDAVGRLLLLGCEHDGRIPPTRSYVWRNLPLDVGHVLAYLVAHEGHHRGQIVMAARQLGHPLSSIAGELWQWTRRAKEAKRGQVQ